MRVRHPGKAPSGKTLLAVVGLLVGWRWFPVDEQEAFGLGLDHGGDQPPRKGPFWEDSPCSAGSLCCLEMVPSGADPLLAARPV